MSATLDGAPLLVASQPEDRVASHARDLQNLWYKRLGVSALVLGVAGFLPSLYHLSRGTVWSVSHDAPHTDVDVILKVHAASMCVWFAAAAVQIPTGGTRFKAAHRRVGYAALLALSVGMLSGAAWTALHDAAEGQAIGAAYTLLLAVCCWANAVLAAYHIRRRRTAEHKDHALMALMWSLDPAFHRAVMWLIRWAMAPAVPDPTRLLIFGKLPVNALLVLCFGAMAICAKRLNTVVMLNVCLQLALFWAGLAMLVLDAAGLEGSPRPGPAIWVPATAGAIIMLAATVVLCAVARITHREAQRKVCSRPRGSSRSMGEQPDVTSGALYCSPTGAE
mmetsp:Transcript_10676/g.24785  ORF Transcript_10676/g.24785 Transcript_10676/m.24785 type:complete len:335 (-) Transcript_10676:77-1081(-)